MHAMATVRWTSDNIVINSAPGAQIGPAVADNGGVEFGVAWINAADGSINVNFFDEQGLPSAARVGAIVTDGAYAGTSAPGSLEANQLPRRRLTLTHQLATFHFRALAFCTASTRLRTWSFSMMTVM
jgi:hypothetical protein